MSRRRRREHRPALAVLAGFDPGAISAPMLHAAERVLLDSIGRLVAARDTEAAPVVAARTRCPS